VILGPGDTKNYSPLFQLAKQGKLTKAFQGSIEFGYVRDIADAHVNAFYSGKEGESYMLGGVHATWREFFQTINTVVGSGVKVKEISRLAAKASVKAGEWWSWLRGKPCKLTSEMLDLLMRYSKVPTMDALRSRDELGYNASRNLLEMCWLTWQWYKHDHSPSLSKVAVADPAKTGEVVSTM
jgi:nucleoside-diphosphate-sugar epimerase